MSIRRIWILFTKELIHGSKGFIFLWAIIMPLLLSFLLAAIFGTLSSEEPKLGVYDRDGSNLTVMLEGYDSLKYREYTSENDIREAAGDGTVDMGIIIPADFDAALAAGDTPTIQAYIWGESQMKNRTILSVTIADMIRELSDQEPPVEITTVLLGDEEEIPWSTRLLPLLMLFAVFLGGIFIPSTSLIDEKIKRTMTALVVTPTSALDVFAAKGLLGFILSLLVGIVVLAINNALGTHPGLLILTMALGGVMAVGIGLIFGVLLKDVSTLFAIWKSAGIVLFGPAIIYMFPAIPKWIGYFFPTFYMLDPLMNITQNGAGWSSIAGNIFILIGIDIAVYIIFFLVLKRSSQFPN